MVNINELKDRAMKAGATEVLLFYGCPVDLAIYVGAGLQNWVVTITTCPNILTFLKVEGDGIISD